MDRYSEALAFATKKHDGQMRKDGVTPYIVHPIGVADMIAGVPFDEIDREIVLSSAVLHDTLEDTDTSYQELVDVFGQKIAQIVLELTSDKLEQKRVGKANYLKHKMQNMSEEALTIKIADRLYNMIDVVCMKPEKIQQFIDQNKEISEWIRAKREDLTDTQSYLLDALDHAVLNAQNKLDNNHNI